jgi:glycosyltransferase involved in cell wall biosynthesis
MYDTRPLVSVIIPVFNRAGCLQRAVASVAEQTFTDWEIVVVDDCSTDNSVEVALNLGLADKLRVVRHAVNQGPSAARNSGIREARGRYVSFLDSDDSWHPEKLARQITLIQSDSDPETIFCVTKTRVEMGRGQVRIRPERGIAPGEPWSEFIYVGDGFAQTNSFLLSRAMALKIPFRTRVRQHEDNLFFLDAEALGARYCLIDDPLSIWNNDDRDDRLGRTSDLALSREFLEEAGSLLTNKARIAFEVTYLGPLLFEENPAAALELFMRALAQGAVTPVRLAGVVARCILPEAGVGLLKRIFRQPRIILSPSRRKGITSAGFARISSNPGGQDSIADPSKAKTRWR